MFVYLLLFCSFLLGSHVFSTTLSDGELRPFEKPVSFDKPRLSNDTATTEYSNLSGDVSPSSYRSTPDKQFDSPIYDNLSDYIFLNNTEKLIELYYHLSTHPEACPAGIVEHPFNRLWTVDATSDDKKIARLFFPYTYLLKHYGRSFTELNETARLCVLIAAAHGHQPSRTMIANAFPFEERDAHFVERLHTSFPESLQEKVQIILETPFALNNQSMERQLDGEEAQAYLHRLVGDTESLEPFVIFNAAYTFLLQGNWQRAFDLFVIAGKKGMTNGYLEAAQIIVDGREVHIGEFDCNTGSNVRDFEAIDALLKDAGNDGKWFVADCYRYSRKIPQNRQRTYELYNDVLRRKPEDPSFFRKYAEFCEENAQLLTTDKKLTALKTAVKYFIIAARHGDYSASEKALVVMNKIRSDKTLASIIADDLEIERALSLVNAMEQKRIDIIALVQTLTNKLMSDIAQ